MKYNEQQTEEPTPVTGPGICEEIAARIAGNTLVSEIDPSTIFPLTTPEDIEKFECRVEGWYNLITQLGELKSQPSFSLSQGNKLGLLYLRIEQYMLFLSDPRNVPQTPQDIERINQAKAQYWAWVEAARNSQSEITPVVAMELRQLEYGDDSFVVTIARPGDVPDYTHTGPWETGFKFATQFYRVRKWDCSSWKVIFPIGDPLQFDQAEPIAAAIAARLDDQQNEIILDNL